MLEQLFIDNIVFALIVWTIIYVADYYLTIYGAHLYRTHAQDHLTIEGSYELTPIFRHDVDALKMVSVRFLTYVAVSILLVFLIWLFSVQLLGIVAPYSFALGALMLREAVIHLRHWRNILMFRRLKESDQVRGKIEYSKRFLLRSSADELFTFAIFFFLLSITLSSWFVFGGAFGCLAISIQHWNLARKSINPTK